MIEPLPSVTRRSSRIKAKLNTSEKSTDKLTSDSHNFPLRHRSKSMIATVNDLKHSKTNEISKTKKNNTVETLKEMQAKILSQLSFLPPPLESTVERLAGSIRPRSYSMHDLASTSKEHVPHVPARICPPGILKRPSTDHRITLMRPRSYSIVERSVTFAVDTLDNQKDKTSLSTTGGESSPIKSKKYSRSYSTVGFATSPTRCTQPAQEAASTDIWKKREDPRRRPSIASHLLDVLTHTKNQTADSTTGQTSIYDPREAPGTSKSTNSPKPRSYSTSGRIIGLYTESRNTTEQTARFTLDSNARETMTTDSSNRNKPISHSYTIGSGKFANEPQSRKHFLGNHSPRTPSPGQHSPGPSRSGLERSTSYLGNVDGNQDRRQDRSGRKSNYDGDRRMSMYVSKAPTEESLPEHHKTFLAHIIRWNPAWLAEYMLHDTLPPIFHETKTDIPVMMYTYKNFQVYSE